jgi:hypothetical protein
VIVQILVVLHLESIWSPWIPGGFHAIITKICNIVEIHMDSTWTPWSLGGICGLHLESMGEGKVHVNTLLYLIITGTPLLLLACCYFPNILRLSTLIRVNISSYSVGCSDSILDTWKNPILATEQFTNWFLLWDKTRWLAWLTLVMHLLLPFNCMSGLTTLLPCVVLLVQPCPR